MSRLVTGELADRRDRVRKRPERRLEVRRGLGGRIPRRDVGEGYASTCRAIGYVLRDSEPVTAMRWYWRAATWSGRPAGLVRGLLACAARWASGRRTPAAAENATANR